jgi:inosine-uridine nucleoside N-ribohydrolase
MQYSYPADKRTRVIVNTDAKNEADDQYAIVHAILTKSFELHGIIPAHFGKRGYDTLQASHDEVNLLLKLMHIEGKVRVEPGARLALVDEKTPQPSAGAQLIIDEAMKDDPRTLNVLFYGPLTDMASALLIEPRLESRPIRVVWIGGGAWPDGGREFNGSNDIHSANVVFKSNLEVWQIPFPVFRFVAVGYAELVEKVYPHGELGRYLVKQLIEFNERNAPDRATECHCLGDSPAVGAVIYPDAGRWSMKPAPEFDLETMEYKHTGRNRAIRVYESFDTRFLMEDFFAKLAQFARESA